ncbi:MAG: GNAT family N-acetyltransferase [Dehalococcoidia bacterium]|nr:GNAT family N-acetyltransferase [Dehalococcoidia bacterium]
MAWIAGERVILRAWEREDIRARWEADQTADAESQRLGDWHKPPPSLLSREQEWEAEQSEPDASTVSLVIVADGRPVGDITLFQIDPRIRHALIGLSLWRPEDRDHGYGSDAIRALLRWSFGHMNLHRIELAVDATNVRAIHVYEKLGFVHEGRRRQHHFDAGIYHDELTMGLLDVEFWAADGSGPGATRPD